MKETTTTTPATSAPAAQPSAPAIAHIEYDPSDVTRQGAPAIAADAALTLLERHGALDAAGLIALVLAILTVAPGLIDPAVLGRLEHSLIGGADAESAQLQATLAEVRELRAVLTAHLARRAMSGPPPSGLQ